MAKWGEGDPRWIVEERPDATNVNNWHWTEKNAAEWSKEKLNFLFKNMKLIQPGLGTVIISDVLKCDGEASVNNRKGKLIFFYEWVLELEWKAETEKESDCKEIKGTITIPNLSEENDPNEVDVNVSLTLGGDTGSSFKEFIRTKGANEIQAKIGQYIEALKEEYSSNILLPTKNSDTPQSTNAYVANNLTNNIKNIQVSCPSEIKSSNSSGVKIDTCSLSFSRSFKCNAQELYNALTIKEMVCAFTRNDVKINAEKGGKFELFGGNITGEFVELEPYKKIVQKWRFKAWPAHHHSVVTLIIDQLEDSTKIDLKQTGIPSNDLERTREGWQNYYWESIKQTFGFGATLI